jgi:hypothetical protein
MKHAALLAIGLAAPVLLALAAVTVNAAAPAKSPVVLELFTSQGCSSCPPADALLGRYAKQNGVIALSYSVDYWDYLGWHDTLASPANSARQRAYAAARGDGAVYTPQMVVDGMRHAVGSEEGSIDATIAAAERQRAGSLVPVSLQADHGMLVIRIGAAPAGSKKRAAMVLLVSAKSLQDVHIARGENGGRTIAYHDAVRGFRPVGRWTGEALTLRVPILGLGQGGADRFAALLQTDGPGEILGAAETVTAETATR